MVEPLKLIIKNDVVVKLSITKYFIEGFVWRKWVSNYFKGLGLKINSNDYGTRYK